MSTSHPGPVPCLSHALQAPSALQGTRTHRRYRDKTRWFLCVASSHRDEDLDDSDKSQSRLGTRNKGPLLLHE